MCKVRKAKQEFSKTQWEQPSKIGSRCQVCCGKNCAERQTTFAAWRKQQTGPASTATMELCVVWERGDKAEAERWLLEAPVTKLPSVDVKSYQCMHGLGGRPRWTTKQLDHQAVAAGRLWHPC